MQLFDVLDSQLFKPLAGRYQRIFAELLMLIWDHCRSSTDYGMGKSEMIRLAEDYLDEADFELSELDSAEESEEQIPSRDVHSRSVWCVARLRNSGWLEDLEIGYEEDARTAICPQVVPILQAFYAIIHPQTVTYSGKLNKAYQLLDSIATESAPYENVLKEVAAAMDELNSALRNLNASIGSFIDQMTHHKTPQEVLDLFEKYEEEIVVAAYQRFKTSDNLFNYREALLEGLDNCQDVYMDALAADYCKVERCAESEAVGTVLSIIDRIRDDLTLMGELITEIDKNHITYRQRAVQRAQFMLLTDGTTQGRINSLLRYYAQTLETSASLFDVDDSPLSRLWKIYPTEVLGRSYLKPPVTSRKPTPIEPLNQPDALDEQELRNAQQALLAYARSAVTIWCNGQCIQTDMFRGGIAISSDTLEEIEQIHVPCGRVISVENLTTYHDTKESQGAIIYLGGFLNTVRTNLLKKLYAHEPDAGYFHKGDLDPYGFLILENLKNKTGIPFEPLEMDLNTLRHCHHAGHFRPLDEADRKAITSPALAEYQPILQYMLQHDCKIEQECFAAMKLEQLVGV